MLRPSPTQPKTTTERLYWLDLARFTEWMDENHIDNETGWGKDDIFVVSDNLDAVQEYNGIRYREVSSLDRSYGGLVPTAFLQVVTR